MSSTNDHAAGSRKADAIVIGDGIIGLSTALELEQRGLRCVVFGAERPGTASIAAAGLLAPSIGHLPAAVRPFFEKSLRLYPALLASLPELGDGPTLMTGLLVVGDAGDAPESMRRGQPLGAEEARRLEPGVDAPHGAVLHSNDGAIDNVRLMRALRRAVEQRPRIGLIAEDPVSSIEVSPGLVRARSDAGIRAEAPRAIVAAGAWSPQIAGLPRPLPVFPLKGQMIALDSCPIRRPVVGSGVYLVPRGTKTVVGSTSERAGFDVTTSPDAVDRLHTAAAAVCPALGASRVARAWTGVRPATPDMLPILGADPEHPELLYATGHSRNGILLAPATARALADLVVGCAPGFDLSGFGIARFGSDAGDANHTV
jgi:glycine/D-amino acid oxidase-like deaminating enzyme